MLRPVLFCLCLAFALTVSAEIYKSRDEKGEVIYSDQPQEGAERVELPEANTTPAVEVKERPKKKPEKGFQGYDVAIATPKNEAIIPNGLAPTDVHISLEPALREGDVVFLILDGQVFASDTSTHFTIPQLSRGSHTLQVEVLAQGEFPAGQSEPVSIFVYWPGGN